MVELSRETVVLSKVLTPVVVVADTDVVVVGDGSSITESEMIVEVVFSIPVLVSTVVEVE